MSEKNEAPKTERKPAARIIREKAVAIIADAYISETVKVAEYQMKKMVRRGGPTNEDQIILCFPPGERTVKMTEYALTEIYNGAISDALFRLEFRLGEETEEVKMKTVNEIIEALRLPKVDWENWGKEKP